MRLAIAMTGCALLVASCGAASTAREDGPSVGRSSGTLAEPGWSAENRARVERALSAIRERAGRRVAVFDWDNTMMRGDIGDVVLAHVIERGLLAPLEPPDAYPLLTPAACEALAAAGEPGEARDRVLAHLAWRGTTPEGAPAFTIPRSSFHRATYGFMAQLLVVGRTDEELRAIARDAWRGASAAPIGARAEIGGVEVERFARLHAPMVELARALEGAGVEVFFVSASAQAIVEAMAEVAGFQRAQVIGLRTEHAPDGRAIARFEGCGQGDDETPVTTWDEGKRCWINRVIFELPLERQRAQQHDAALRPVLAAGDSDGDHAMLEDATELRIVLDRGQPRVTASALADPSRWILQPLFVDPAPR